MYENNKPFLKGLYYALPMSASLWIILILVAEKVAKYI